MNLHDLGTAPAGIADFRRLLRARGSSLEQIAAEVGTTRSYLSRILWAHLESADTRKRLHSVTTADEWAVLCTLEHFATWNTAQLALESGDNAARAWLMRQECMHCHGDRRFVACRKHMARDVTHGLCPDCLRLHFPDFAAEVLAMAAKTKAA